MLSLTMFGRQCTIFSTIIFLAWKILPGPHMKGQTWFHELFCFREDIRLQNLKIVCLCTQRLHGHAAFSLDTKIFIFYNYCCWNFKHAPVSFFTYSESLTWHRVSVVVDYADTYFSRISSQKRKHSQNCFWLFSGFFFSSKKVLKISWHCPIKYSVEWQFV